MYLSVGSATLLSTTFLRNQASASGVFSSASTTRSQARHHTDSGAEKLRRMEWRGSVHRALQCPVLLLNLWLSSMQLCCVMGTSRAVLRSWPRCRRCPSARATSARMASPPRPPPDPPPAAP